MAYQPASNLTSTSSITHLATVYYKKRALDNLMKKFIFSEVCIKDSLPKMNGKTVQWYRYIPSAMLPSGTPATKTEGTVGTGMGLTTVTVSATVSQYADFASVSDMLKETAIDPVMDNAADMMSYRASYIVDTVTRIEIDSPNSTVINSATNAGQVLLGAYYRAADARSTRHQLQGLEVQPMQSGPARGSYMGIIHPYVSYDLVNDPAAGGLMDILKFTKPEQFISNEDRAHVADVGGVKFWENNNVATFLDTVNKWRVYVFGEGGVGVVDLAGAGPKRVKDPSKERFNLNIIPGEAGPADPEGVIGGWVSYNFKFVAKVLDTVALSGQYRYRMVDAPSSIVA
jgi:N4-gp56 family major capsid protein